MKIISVSNIDKFTNSIRPKTLQKDKKTVESILKNVQKRGDSAVRLYEKKFSGFKITNLRIQKKEIKSAYSQVSKNQIQAIIQVKKRLEKTESSLKKQLKQIKINTNGIKIQKTFVPIESVGCYVPGGLATYPTSLVMSVIPAKIAGVKRIVVASPPQKNGKMDPLTIVAADLCGVDEIYKTGGVQAIAALSFGTNSILKVDKIVGPGGSFVTSAKFLVSDQTSIDMIAGPTELGIIADSNSSPDLIADDLFSQAEHSKDTFCYVITTSKKLAADIRKSINKKIKITKRADIIKASLKNNGFIAICKSETDTINLANSLAPEHLEIMTKNARKLSSRINSAGLILIGKNTPSSASDYLLGSNHILPTNGFGKTRSSLSVLDFLKLKTELESSKPALQLISKNLQELTQAEGLPNHYCAVRSRI